MYGSAWTDNRDSSYTTTGNMIGFSPLDLYLMGMIDKSQVPPMTLIENAAEDRNRIPLLGAAQWADQLRYKNRHGPSRSLPEN